MFTGVKDIATALKTGLWKIVIEKVERIFRNQCLINNSVIYTLFLKPSKNLFLIGLKLLSNIPQPLLLGLRTTHTDLVFFLIYF